MASTDPAAKGETTQLHVPVSVLGPRSHSRAIQVPRLAPGTYLLLREGDEVSVIEIEKEITHIGRGFNADLRIEDATISRRHALLIRHGDEHSVLDDRSANGVFVNDVQVQRSALVDGDRLRLGQFELVFVRVSADPA